MPIEIEVKLAVDGHEPVESRLRSLGAELVCRQRQVDCYFDDADRSLTASDKCLRLRTQIVADQRQCILTFKGPKKIRDVKERLELEVTVEDPQATAQLLAALGLTTKLAIEKRRTLWRGGGCLVALDELPLLGFFVEIEGPSSQEIVALQARLGLADRVHISESYASMMDEKLRQLGCNRREAFFDDTDRPL